MPVPDHDPQMSNPQKLNQIRARPAALFVGGNVAEICYQRLVNILQIFSKRLLQINMFQGIVLLKCQGRAKALSSLAWKLVWVSEGCPHPEPRSESISSDICFQTSPMCPYLKAHIRHLNQLFLHLHVSLLLSWREYPSPY